MPSQTMNRGAKAVRGMPLRAMMIGSKISARSLLRPKAYPRAMPEIAPIGKPMAISINVTHVCCSRSPSVKPVNIDEKIRLGLLIRKGSIQRPDAISHREKKPTTMAVRSSVTVTPRIVSGDLAAVAAPVSEEVPWVRVWLISSGMFTLF